jgi:hypothetical protein
MELDKAFKLAVIFAREDLMNVTQPAWRGLNTNVNPQPPWIISASGWSEPGVTRIRCAITGRGVLRPIQGG